VEVGKNPLMVCNNILVSQVGRCAQAASRILSVLGIGKQL
jgi:hypothetical protein